MWLKEIRRQPFASCFFRENFHLNRSIMAEDFPLIRAWKALRPRDELMMLLKGKAYLPTLTEEE